MKRTTKKATASARKATKAPQKPKQHKCKRDGCKSRTVYMKMNQKTKTMEHWCGPHFKKDVEEPQGIANIETVQRYKKDWDKRQAAKPKRTMKKSEPKKRTIARKK